MKIFRRVCYAPCVMAVTFFIVYCLQPDGWACLFWGLGALGGTCFGATLAVQAMRVDHE